MRLKMRRGFSILLVLLFALAPFAPALQAVDDDAGLPACCRRHGAHHCALSAHAAQAQIQARNQPASSSKAAFSAPSTCPYYPGPATFVTGPAAALAASAATLPTPPQEAFAPAPAPSAAPSRTACSHAGRGPPTTI